LIRTRTAARVGRRQAWVAAGVVALWLSLPRPGAAAAGSATASPREVEAAFVRNFASYVAWPAQAFASDHAPWHVCVLGRDPFGGALEETLQGRTVQGRTFQIFRGRTVAELPECHIAVVLLESGERRRAALDALKGRPVLTVGDAPGFLQEGGIILFHVSDHVEFSVNLDQARAASLRVQTKMLEVAREVVDNGITRRRG
jgi:uncharacterized protein DUF4154